MTHLTALATSRLTISCHNFTPPSAPHRVNWSSDAYTTKDEHFVIFESEGNPDFSVKSDHPNAENYEVDPQYRLTINEVSIMDDPGRYECGMIFTSGEERVHKYQLSVGGTYTFCLCHAVLHKS